MNDVQLKTALSMPVEFQFGEVSSLAVPAVAPEVTAATPAAPSLGPLAAFTGTFHGVGFNTIFRPDNPETPTKLPTPVSGSDNVLELNVTNETLSFSPSLGTVPNRGEVQGDISLNGVPYLQTINDVTNPGQSVGIHFEPGLWMIVPATTDPAEGATIVRMASIPHGTTIVAQGKSTTIKGKPTFAAIDITPTANGGGPIPFPSQTATTQGTARIPQDLTAFIKAGTVTQAMLTNPAILLTNHVNGLDILSTDVITISTDPAAPLFGGGTRNIAFLLGNAAATAPNAEATKMTAIFWIETVEYTIPVPVFEPGQPALNIPATAGPGGQPVPTFTINPPVAVTAPRTIKATATQIQYAQQVFLNFNGLSWPHVSVATLVPASPVAVPASAWT
jgi:hypothetical protein